MEVESEQIAGRIHDYESLVASATAVASFTVGDERSAAALCYTSGTTGRPTWVLYDHRSVILHAMSLLMVDSFAISEADTVMPIVPMFHVNAWGLPYAALMSGAKLVMPGPATAPDRLIAAMAAHRVTFAAAVPTVWQSAYRTSTMPISARCGASSAAAARYR